MSIATEVSRLQSAKAAIKAAIEGKGVTVPEATLLDGMAALIESIEAGGGDTQIDSLISRTITEISNNRVTSVGSNAFQKCTALTTADFPSVTRIDNYAFSGCTALTTAYFPSATSIGTYAFENCRALKTADFPSATSIGNNAFQNCRALTTAYFPSATSIGTYAFENCRALTTADFQSVTSIFTFALRYCSNLTALILRSETLATLSNTNALTSTPISSGTGYIYVPSVLVYSYKEATNWATYANQIRAIEDYPEITGGAA